MKSEPSDWFGFFCVGNLEDFSGAGHGVDGGGVYRGAAGTMTAPLATMASFKKTTRIELVRRLR
jgi:hypothetical protein